MRIHPVAHCSLEFFRWAVRSLPRPDGRAYARSMQQPISKPVLQLHGELDGCVLPATAQGSSRHVSADYEWRLLAGVGPLSPAREPRAGVRRADPVGQARLSRPSRADPVAS